MTTYAKTGISLPSDLLKSAKMEAQRRHLTFSGLVCHGLRSVLKDDRDNLSSLQDTITNLEYRITRIEKEKEKNSF